MRLKLITAPNATVDAGSGRDATIAGTARTSLLAAALAALALAPPAAAQDSSSDGDGVYGTTSVEHDTAGDLTPSCGGDDPVVLRSASGTASTTSSTINCSDGSVARCDGKKFWVELKNLHGAVLWRYYIGVQWCWNRGRVTKVRFTRWPQITSWGQFYAWEFVGHVAWSAYPNNIQPGRT